MTFLKATSRSIEDKAVMPFACHTIIIIVSLSPSILFIALLTTIISSFIIHRQNLNTPNKDLRLNFSPKLLLLLL